MSEPEVPPAADGIPRRRRRPDISGPLDQGDSWADRVGLNSLRGLNRAAPSGSSSNGALRNGTATNGGGSQPASQDRLAGMATLSGGMPVADPVTPDAPAPVSHWTTMPVEVPVEVPVEPPLQTPVQPVVDPMTGREPGPVESAATHWSAEPLWSPDPGRSPDPAWTSDRSWSSDPGLTAAPGRLADPGELADPGRLAGPDLATGWPPEPQWTSDLPTGHDWQPEPDPWGATPSGWSPEPASGLGGFTPTGSAPVGSTSTDPSWSAEPSWSTDAIWSTGSIGSAEPTPVADPAWGADPLQGRLDHPVSTGAPDAGRQLTVVDLTALERGSMNATGTLAPPETPPSPPQAASGSRPVRPGPATPATNLTGPIPVAPPISRRSGAEARTGALRLAAIVEAAGSPGAPNARRILSTGPISFDAIDAQDSPFAGPSGQSSAAQPAEPGDPGSQRRRSRRAAGEPDQARRALTSGGVDPGAASAGNGFEHRPEAAPGRGAAAPASAARSGRSGRNLPAAIGVGLLMAVAVVASLLLRKEAFVGLVSAAAVLAVWELATVLTSKRIHIPVIPLAVGALGMLVSAYVAREEGLLISFTLTAFGVLLWRIIDGVEGATRDVAAAVFTAAYVPFMAGFSIVMLAAPDGARRVLIFIAVTVASDVGGYTAGVLFGRHPMAPTISPKKSWEGFTGSVVMCMAVAVAGVIYLLHGPWTAGLAVGAAAAVTATVGDLSESLLKRDLGVKDMGNLLPGHGGMMDRLDSLLLTAPAVYLLLTLLVPTP